MAVGRHILGNSPSSLRPYISYILPRWQQWQQRLLVITPQLPSMRNYFWAGSQIATPGGQNSLSAICS